jgi:hypothetical protein
MTSSPPLSKRNPALVVLDVTAGILLLIVGVVLGLAVIASAVSYGGIQANCGAAPYSGLTCNAAVLAIVVYGLIVVAVLAFFLGLGFFVVNLVRRRYGFYWPLAALVVTLGLFYLGTWVAGLTVP